MCPAKRFALPRGVGLGKLRKHRHSLTDQLNCPFATALAKREESEQMKRIGVVRCLIKDLAVKGGGPRKAASLVMLEGGRQFGSNFRPSTGCPISDNRHIPWILPRAT